MSPSSSKQFISDFDEGQNVESVFLVINKELRPKKNGGKYLRLILADKTGQVICNMWDNFESTFPLFQIDDYVMVKGMAKMFQQKIQLHLLSIQKVDAEEINHDDFHKTSEKDSGEMWNEFSGLIDSITDSYLKTLLKNIYEKPEIKDRFLSSPAAKAMHHSYQSGLLEHTLSLAKLCVKIVEHYSTIPLNRDLLLTGAMLHDYGKIFELTYERGYNYTDEGRLLGHISIEAIEIQKEIDKIEGFPAETRLQLLHMILAHHGVHEYGSPKRPKTLEALILYYLDDLDAKIDSMYRFITENAADGKWAGFESKQFERFIYKGSLITPEDNYEE